MREVQTVYVRIDGKPKDVIADFRIKPVEAIVLTPEQYREDMRNAFDAGDKNYDFDTWFDLYNNTPKEKEV